MNYSELEDLYIEFKRLEIEYYKRRYSYWQALHKIKAEVKRSDGLNWKTFEGKCRTLTKKVRKTLLKQKTRGTVLDHKTSCFEAYILGWSVEQTCSTSNLEWIKRKDNMNKSILSTDRWKLRPFS